MTESLELSLRGLPEWLIREYLAEMGATVDEGAACAAHPDGWSVSWSSQRVTIPGSSLGLTQFDLVFRGSDLDRVHDAFMKKAQRGGG